MVTAQTQHDAFPQTRWSLVLAVREDAGAEAGERAQQALAELCEIYWPPIYNFVRSQGRGREDAQDMTQAFVASLLERGTFAAANQEKGRMRSFLRVALKRFLINQAERGAAQKRGGGVALVPIEVDELEGRLLDSNTADPARLFDRQWALVMLERVMENLAEEYRRAGKEVLFRELREQLAPEGGGSNRELAQRLQITEGALRVAVFRLRRRYRELLRDAIAQTVEAEGEIDDEIRFLMNLFGEAQSL